MGVEFGRGEPFVELEVDGPGAGIDAELAISAVIVLPAGMGIGEEVVDQFFDSAFKGQTALGGCPALPVDASKGDLGGGQRDALIGIIPGLDAFDLAAVARTVPEKRMPRWVLTCCVARSSVFS